MSGICHIIGLDEIHKKGLSKHLPGHIKIIDLDEIQQMIYNHDDIVKQRKIWEELGKEIMVKRKQKKLIGSKMGNASNIDDDIKKLLAKRKMVKQNIHTIWKEKMTMYVDKNISKYRDYRIVFLGFNIFPKDYRVRINIPVKQFPDEVGVPNRILFDIQAKKYASNQIKFYLRNYADRIIRGIFPLNLLKIEYLVNKYEKFSQFYENLGYVSIPKEQLLTIISKLDKQINMLNEISNKIVYVATIYKSGDIIPFFKQSPIQGFLNKEDAIDHVRNKVKNNRPIYIYQISPDQFQVVDGKLLAIQELYPLEEEALLLTPRAQKPF